MCIKCNKESTKVINWTNKVVYVITTMSKCSKCLRTTLLYETFNHNGETLDNILKVRV